MKKLVLLCIVLLLSGCRSVKSTQDTSSVTKQSEKKEVKSDSFSKIQTNGAIKDKIVTVVPKSETNNARLDSLVDAKVDRILKMLNTSKSSGGNNYRFEYDKLSRELRAYFELAETKNELMATNNSETTETSFEQKTDEYIKQKIKAIPFWIYIVIGLWFLPQIMQRVMFVVNPIAGVVSKIKPTK